MIKVVRGFWSGYGGVWLLEGVGKVEMLVVKFDVFVEDFVVFIIKGYVEELVVVWK